MSRTSIPVDSETKERLDDLKQDGETWDEFLLRVAADDEPIQKGFMSEEGVEAVRENIKQRRENF